MLMWLDNKNHAVIHSYQSNIIETFETNKKYINHFYKLKK